MTEFQSGQQLFAGPDCDEVLAEAKKYIVDMQLDTDKIKLIRRENQILVEVR